MTAAQKVIKYFALALGIFIIVTIVSAIVGAGYAVFNGFTFVNKAKESTINFNNYESYIDASIRFAELDIKIGDELKVETTDDRIVVTKNDNKLKIEDNNKSRRKMKGEKVTIYIPKDMEFDVVSIRSGAGKINAESINTKELELFLGAGETIINNITSNKTNIDAGVGKFVLNNAKLNDLDLEMGIGDIEIKGDITGKSNIEAGIGELTLDLNSTLEDYTFDIDKGIGSISINDKKVSEGTTGNGTNKINIDGGIGSIDIYTK